MSDGDIANMLRRDLNAARTEAAALRAALEGIAKEAAANLDAPDAQSILALMHIERAARAALAAPARAPGTGMVAPTNWALGSRWRQWDIVDATYRVTRIFPGGKAKLAWEQADGGPVEQVNEYEFDPKRWTFAGWVTPTPGPLPVARLEQAEKLLGRWRGLLSSPGYQGTRAAALEKETEAFLRASRTTTKGTR